MWEGGTEALTLQLYLQYYKVHWSIDHFRGSKLILFGRNMQCC